MIYVRDIIEKFGGRLVCGNMDLEIKNISKDTRTIKEGDIYIGIKGETFDGNQVILKGLNVGDKVVVDGTQNRMMRPGATVKVVESK